MLHCCIIHIGIPRVRATLITTDNATVRSLGQLLVFNFNLGPALNFGNVKSFETSPVIGIGCSKSLINWLIHSAIHIKQHQETSRTHYIPNLERKTFYVLFVLSLIYISTKKIKFYSKIKSSYETVAAGKRYWFLRRRSF